MKRGLLQARRGAMADARKTLTGALRRALGTKRGSLDHARRVWAFLAVIGLVSVGSLVATSPADAATGVTFSTAVPDPIGVAATPGELFVTTLGLPSATDCNAIWSVSTSGVASIYANPSAAPLGLPCNSDEEYLAIAPEGFGAIPAGTLFVADGPDVYTVAAGGCGNSSSCVSLFATLPTIATAPMGGSHTGLAFDTVGTFGGDLLAVGENNSGTGDVYVIPSGGGTVTSPLVTIPAVEGLEAPSVLPSQWGPYSGDLMAVSDQSNAVYIVTPSGGVTLTLQVTGAEATAVIPPSPCNFGGSSYFASFYGTTTVEGYPPSALGGQSGDVLVNSEGTNDAAPFPGVLELIPSGTSASPTVTTFDDSPSAAVQQEGGAIANCPEITVTTSLSSGSTSGPTITVPSGTAVTDSATLTGETSDAGGTVTYAVYSDSGCSTLVANAGTVTVTNGSVPPSNPVTLTATTNPTSYYWQASYSGDNLNAPSTSVCGAEVETVTPPSTSGTGPTFTPGYFKNNHDNITCATWSSIPEPALGDYTITSCAGALAILKETACGHADGLVKCTAEQVLVAELNVYKGATYGGGSSSCIVTAPNGIDAANALLAGDVGPSGYAGPTGTYTITNGATNEFQAAQTTLSDYNQDRSSTSSSTC
jgi:hypothetical protein